MKCPEVLFDNCLGCGACISACPTGSLSLVSVERAEPPEKKKDPCKALERRINEIRLKRKLYQSQKVKQYCEKAFGGEDGSAYRQMVGKLQAYMGQQEFETYQDGVDFIDGLEPNDIAAVDYNITVDPTTGMDTDVTDTIDEYSDRQQEALNEEMENLLNNFKDSGCAYQ